MISQKKTMDDRIGYMKIRLMAGKAIKITGKKESILLDPDEKILAAAADKKVRIVIFTSKEEGSGGVDEGRVVIRGPGEYEVGGVEMEGFRGSNGDWFYLINVDGVKVGVFLGAVESLSKKTVEEVAGVDVFLAAILAGDDKNNKKIVELSKEWGVNYLVPMDGGVDVKRFLDSVDREDLRPTPELLVESDKLPDGMEVVYLKNG